jgi:hypothetical protein
MRTVTSTKTKRFLYAGFSGLNTSKADIALENQERQAVVSMDNAYCDWRGFLGNERPIESVGEDDARVLSVKWFSLLENDAIYAVRTGSGVSMRSLLTGISEEDIWPVDAIPAICIFNRKAVLTAAGEYPVVYNGLEWRQLSNPDAFNARFSATVQNRLVLAGYSTDPNEIVVCRVNREDILPSDEAPNEASTIKAFRFNIQNLIGSAEVVSGLGVFESTKLAIFTGERVIVYTADPEQTKWALDSSSTINVGTISHNTIAGSANELLYCSRSGVHSLRRSSSNGMTMFTIPLSEPIAELYRSLVDMVANKEAISACFDRDSGVYHIFFPVGDRMSYRLSLALDPTSQEGQAPTGRWSLSKFGGLTCGDFLGGRMLFGSIAGMKLQLGETSEGARGAAEVEFPVLWHGDFISPKLSHQLILYAAGSGVVTISASDEAG